MSASSWRSAASSSCRRLAGSRLRGRLVEQRVVRRAPVTRVVLAVRRVHQLREGVGVVVVADPAPRNTWVMTFWLRLCQEHLPFLVQQLRAHTERLLPHRGHGARDALVVLVSVVEHFDRQRVVLRIARLVVQAAGLGIALLLGPVGPRRAAGRCNWRRAARSRRPAISPEPMTRFVRMSRSTASASASAASGCP